MNNFKELQLIESIVETSPAIIFRWIIQEGWPVEYVSRNIERLGYTREEMISGRVSWPGITHPDDLSRLEDEVKDFLAEGTDRWTQTYRICTRDGTYRWVQDWNLLLRDELGFPQKIQGIVIDITKEKTEQEERMLLQKKLQDALEKVLSGFIPICAKCKKIRDHKGYWHQVEDYIGERSEAVFSHGICPDCGNELYGERFKNDK